MTRPSTNPGCCVSDEPRTLGTRVLTTPSGRSSALCVTAPELAPDSSRIAPAPTPPFADVALCPLRNKSQPLTQPRPESCVDPSGSLSLGSVLGTQCQQSVHISKRRETKWRQKSPPRTLYKLSSGFHSRITLSVFPCLLTLPSSSLVNPVQVTKYFFIQTSFLA